METNIKSGYTYKNNKTGNLYNVVATGKHTETGELFVIYVAADFVDKQLWVRPLELFEQRFTEMEV